MLYMLYTIYANVDINTDVRDFERQNRSPRSRNSPVMNALRDCETLKQWEINLARAVTTRNLVARARSVSNASRRLSRPR